MELGEGNRRRNSAHSPQEGEKMNPDLLQLVLYLACPHAQWPWGETESHPDVSLRMWVPTWLCETGIYVCFSTHPRIVHSTGKLRPFLHFLLQLLGKAIYFFTPASSVSVHLFVFFFIILYHLSTWKFKMIMKVHLHYIFIIIYLFLIFPLIHNHLL